MNDFEEGRYLASTIAGARLVALESSNHIVLGDEPAWPVFVDEVAAFMAPDRPTGRTGSRARSGIGAVAARARRTPACRTGAGQRRPSPESLTLSIRTVERHLHNTYAKLGIHGKSARAAAVARLMARA